MDQGTGKLMIMLKALHSRNDSDRLDISRRKKRFLFFFCFCFSEQATSEEHLGDSVQKSKERLITKQGTI